MVLGEQDSELIELRRIFRELEGGLGFLDKVIVYDEFMAQTMTPPLFWRFWAVFWGKIGLRHRIHLRSTAATKNE